jgi:hypothetical protein
MDFENEPFVKIYTNETPTVRYWGFWGTVLMEQLVKKANRAGVIELPGDLSHDLCAAVAGIIGCGSEHIEWVRKYLPSLLDHGAVTEIEENDTKYLVLSRYHEAQYGGVDVKFSKRWSAQKQKETEAAVEAGVIEPPFWWKDSVKKAV